MVPSLFKVRLASAHPGSWSWVVFDGADLCLALIMLSRDINSLA